MIFLTLVSQTVFRQTLNSVYSEGLPFAAVSKSSYKILNNWIKGTTCQAKLEFLRLSMTVETLGHREQSVPSFFGGWVQKQHLEQWKIRLSDHL